MRRITGQRDLRSCELCPRRCKVNRAEGQKGFCRAGASAQVQSYFAHHGEEPALSGERGSGTVFFSHCTMHCVYCQNYTFSQLSEGREVSARELSRMMLELQKAGCHNINLVTPTHYVPQILEALLCAAGNGLNIPIVYNTSGYDLVETLRLLDGIVDIYLPDMRYGDDAAAQKFSNAPDYVAVNRRAVTEMFRQVGGLVTDGEGIATRGLIVRHLVLPNGIASTEQVFKFLSENSMGSSYVSLMSQYYPTYQADRFPEISRRIKRSEYGEAFDLLIRYGLLNGWVQESSESMDARLLGTNIKPMR